jgi:hypothetical protein
VASPTSTPRGSGRQRPAAALKLPNTRIPLYAQSVGYPTAPLTLQKLGELQRPCEFGE